jgi:hypothetical protein
MDARMARATISLDNMRMSLRSVKRWSRTEPEYSPQARKLIADIEYRIKRSRRLSLLEIGYRGDDLIEMHELLFGKKPKGYERYTHPSIHPIQDTD